SGPLARRRERSLPVGPSRPAKARDDHHKSSVSCGAVRRHEAGWEWKAVRAAKGGPSVILWELSERLRLRRHLTRLYRVEIRGAEHVPLTGPCILVANHESLIDPWILCLATPRRVRFMAKAELWRYPGVRWAMDAYGTFPVERGNGDTG